MRTTTIRTRSLTFFHHIDLARLRLVLLKDTDWDILKEKQQLFFLKHGNRKLKKKARNYEIILIMTSQ